MSFKELLQVSKNLPVVKNNLILKEQAAYCLAWNKLIGKQEKVLYNCMGPDLTTVLLTTNASEITGIDIIKLYVDHLTGFVLGAWDLVDAVPLYLPGDSWYSDKGNTLSAFIPKDKDLDLFKQDMGGRQRRGYWDISYIGRWKTGRLLAIELKKLGVDRNTLVIDELSSYNTSITFNWAFPGEKPSKRTLKYLYGSLPELIGRGEVFSDIDCYYEKSTITDPAIRSLELLLPRVNPLVLIGKEGSNTKTEQHKQEVKAVLSERYKELILPSQWTEMIENLPDDEDEWVRYQDDPERATRYGMELFGFKSH